MTNTNKLPTIAESITAKFANACKGDRARAEAVRKGINDGINYFHAYDAQFYTEDEKFYYRQAHWAARSEVDFLADAHGYEK